MEETTTRKDDVTDGCVCCVSNLVLHDMGMYLYDLGEYERATEHLRESLNIHRRLSSVNKVYMASSE